MAWEGKLVGVWLEKRAQSGIAVVLVCGHYTLTACLSFLVARARYTRYRAWQRIWDSPFLRRWVQSFGFGGPDLSTEQATFEC